MATATRRRGTLLAKRSVGCRRRDTRNKLVPVSAICWGRSHSPAKAVLIEADGQGARLSLNRPVASGETLKVSLEDRLGQFRTVEARVVWVRPLEFARGVVVGVAFAEPVELAA